MYGHVGPWNAADWDIFLPNMPTTDGDYKLHVAGGVPTWVTA
jgi:hypothetical protein